ncbi:MAG: V4R domain-containing protein [Candidatus Hodarchaeales archaeon]
MNSEEKKEVVNIILFEKGSDKSGKKQVCKDCDVVKGHLNKIVATIKKNGLVNIQFKTIGLSENPEMAEIYEVKNVPAVLYNGEVVMTAEEVAMFTAASGSGFGQQTAMGGFEMVSDTSGLQDMGQMTDFGMATDQDGMNPFGQSSVIAASDTGIFNHLFDKLINAGITASIEAVERENWQKYNLLAISEQSRFLVDEKIANIRKRIGDYVHIGVLQGISISLLSVNPNSAKYLFKAGSLMGYFGDYQFRLIQANKKIVDSHDQESKFKEVMKGLEKLFTEQYTGLPLFVSRKGKVKIISKRRQEARLRIYDSAFAARTANIDRPVCHLIAGLISGVLEVTLGFESVKVEEIHCYTMGDDYCEFLIIPGEPNLIMETAVGEAEDFLTKKDKEKFYLSLKTIYANMYKSTLLNEVLRPGLGDYIHISVLQSALNGIKFADPFYSSLLYYAGIHYGKTSLEFGLQKRPEEPPEFEDACKMIEEYFNDPNTILTRSQGIARLNIIDEETATLRIYDCATASGLAAGVMETGEIPLCDFTAGFIDGRLVEILQEGVRVEEIKCHTAFSSEQEGEKYCEFKIAIE